MRNRFENETTAGRQAPDWLLLERSQDGDSVAFDALFRRHRRLAYQFAYRLTRDRDEAGDVVAETLVRMFKALPRFRGRCSFATWMCRITTNCFVDSRRSRQRRQLTSLDASGDPSNGEAALQLEDVSPSSFDLAAVSVEMAALRLAADLLPSRHRAMLIMHHSEMKTYGEMSEALGLPIGTVKSRLNRARRALLALMGELEEEGSLTGEPSMLAGLEPVAGKGAERRGGKLVGAERTGMHSPGAAIA